jgi:hypothetical protein
MIVVLALLLPIAMAAVFLLTRYIYHRPHERDELSPVTRQHIELFQGGQLSEAAVESAKARFRDLLERGEVETIEASLRAGMQYVVQVRALAELGTDDAGQILERQLQRRLTDDHIEQFWYWIDLASGLRSLNRAQSLPHLLRCAEAAGDMPLGHFFAAETVCFLGFAGYLRQTETSLGRAALRVLHRTLEGLRCGVQPAVILEGRLGELVENLWDHRPELNSPEAARTVDPLAVRVFREAVRLLHRAPHLEALLSSEGSEQEALSWQLSRLAALEPVLTDYLHEAPAALCRLIAQRPVSEHRDILLALLDLRAEAGSAVLPLMRRPGYPEPELALEVLASSKSPDVGPAIRDWILDRVPVLRRAQGRKHSSPPRRPSIPLDMPYRSLLRALRGHPSTATEDLLLLASRDWDPTFRQAAVSSLGWWEPLRRLDVLLTLQDARRDLCPEVRQAARAALARLGERHALQWFRQMLHSEDPHHVHETIQAIANEGLFLLWPDLDRLTETDSGDIAHHAREALERLCEDLGR